jgi:hypothetical protein
MQGIPSRTAEILTIGTIRKGIIILLKRNLMDLKSASAANLPGHSGQKNKTAWG